MPWRILLLFLTLPLAIWGRSPKPVDTIDFNRVHVAFLEHLVKEKIDSLRIANGRWALSYDPILRRAALDHARYLARRGRPGHYQRVPQKQDVLQRVQYYGGQHLDKVGENVLWKRPARLWQWDKARHRYIAHYFYTYNQMANAIVRAWMSSQSHYATMMIGGFTHTGLAIHCHPDTKEIMVVQVFGQYLSSH